MKINKSKKKIMINLIILILIMMMIEFNIKLYYFESFDIFARWII